MNEDTKPRVAVLYIIIALNVLAFAFTFIMGLNGRAGALFVNEWSFMPRALSYGVLNGDLELIGHSLVTLVTHTFLHAGPMHLLGNMLFLVFAGRRVEKELGAGLFIVFYLLTGIAGALSQYITGPTEPGIMLGASGAVSGIMGCYVVAAFKGEGRFSPLAIIGALLIGRWLYGQLVSTMAVATGMVDSPIAYFAHLGGFAAGVLLTLRYYRGRKPAVTTGDE